MSAKKVQIEVVQGSGFKTECRAGRHTVIIDQPANAGGTDEGATPLDVQLMALGGCIAAIGRIIAMQRHLNIRGIKVWLEGEVDTDGLLGKSSGKRVGFGAVTARVKLDSDLTPEEQHKLLAEIEKRCPVSDNLQNITPLSITLAP